VIGNSVGFCGAGAEGRMGFGPVGASFLRKSWREVSRSEVEPLLSPLPQSQPMLNWTCASEFWEFEVFGVGESEHLSCGEVPLEPSS